MNGSVIVAIVVIGVIGLIVLMIVHSVRRRKAIQAWAAAHGWTYVGSDRTLLKRWRGQPFNREGRKSTSDVIYGTYRGRNALSFTFTRTWETGSGDDRQTHTESTHITALWLPVTLPSVELTPAGLGRKLARMMGFSGLEFESDDFNKKWHVTADDRKFAYDIVHPRMMEFLMSQGVEGNSMRIEGPSVLTWRNGSLRIEAVEPCLELLDSFTARIPPYVWADRGVVS